jgi:intracellular septation protein A
MWVRNGGLLSAATAALIAAVIVLGAWFFIEHRLDWRGWSSDVHPVLVGALTAGVMLIAGILLTVALSRAEDAILLARRAAPDEGSGD